MRNRTNTFADRDPIFAPENADRRGRSDSLGPRPANRPRTPVLQVVRWFLLTRALFVIVLVVISTMLVIYSVISGAADKRPSLIDDLRGDLVSSTDLTSVSILKFDPGAGWPSAEAHYARKARVEIGAEARSVLLKLLKESTTDGQPPRNHAATFYYNILRIDVGAKGHYYVFCDLCLYEGKYYVGVETGALNNTNPNGVKKYENVPLADFLKKHDRWYRDANSPGIQTRPGYPDNEP
jgi:hypothetical protein